MKGHCACGAVTWQTGADILWAGHCHCDSCRRATSSAFTSFFGVPRKSVSWSGEMTDRASSNGRVVRKFCARCGSQMTIQAAIWPDETHLYAATLEDPTLFQPKAHFHWAERVSWVHVEDDLPKYPGSVDNTEPVG